MAVAQVRRAGLGEAVILVDEGAEEAQWDAIKSSTIKNPVSGAEVPPGAVPPEGLVFKRGDSGASEVFHVDDGISYDHSGQYTAVAPFDYAGP